MGFWVSILWRSIQEHDLCKHILKCNQYVSKMNSKIDKKVGFMFDIDQT